MIMKAAVYRGPGRLVIEELPTPEPGPGEALVKVLMAGVCATDVKTLKRGHPMFVPPVVLGHELVGVVAGVGAQPSSRAAMPSPPAFSTPHSSPVYPMPPAHSMPDSPLADSWSGPTYPPAPAGEQAADLRRGGYGDQSPLLAEGDLVAVAPYVPCGSCSRCLAGGGQLCQAKITLANGAFAEFTLIPEPIVRNGVVKLKPADKPFGAEFTLSEPLACVLRSLRRCGLGGPGTNNGAKSLGVVGAGAMGLLHIWAAKAMGAGLVLACDAKEARTRLARSLGATVTSSMDDFRAKARDLTCGEGLDCVVLATDAVGVVQPALASIRPGGVLCLFGGASPGSTAVFDPGPVHYEEIGIIGSFGFVPDEFAAAVHLIGQSLESSSGVDIEPNAGSRLECGAQARPGFRCLHQDSGVGPCDREPPSWTAETRQWQDEGSPGAAISIAQLCDVLVERRIPLEALPGVMEEIAEGKCLKAVVAFEP